MFPAYLLPLLAFLGRDIFKAALWRRKNVFLLRRMFLSSVDHAAFVGAKKLCGNALEEKSIRLNFGCEGW